MRTTRTHIRLAASAALALGGLAASTAFAGAPGNMIDSEGCEWHSWGGYNHCNTGTTDPDIVAFGDLGGYKIVISENAGAGDTSAFASLVCTNGDAYRGIIGSGGEWRYAECPSGGSPWRSVCGPHVHCQSK